MNVGDWPANDFNQRRAYFKTNKLKLQSKLPPYLSSSLMGTQYWPTGMKISNKLGVDLNRKNASDAAWLRLMRFGSYRNYMLMLLTKDKLALNLLVSVFKIESTSNFEIRYLRHKNADKVFAYSFPDSVGSVILKRFGLIFLIVVGYLFFLQKKLTTKLFLVYFFFLPLLVVMSDGYYEFEKHMVSFFMLLPFLFFFSMPNESESGNLGR